MNYFFQISNGLGVTISIFAITLVFSFPLGIVLGLCRVSKRPALRKITAIYNWIMRGTPLLLQLVFVFFGLPALGIRFDRMTAACLAFSLNYAAYFAEIFRSGIQSVEKGQWEAAEMLGFTPWQVHTKIILPQVLKKTLPSLGNEVITLVKDTSLVYILGVNDVLKLTKGIVNREASLLPFPIAGGIYLIMTYIVTKGFEALEKRYSYKE